REMTVVRGVRVSGQQNNGSGGGKCDSLWHHDRPPAACRAKPVPNGNRRKPAEIQRISKLHPVTVHSRCPPAPCAKTRTDGPDCPPGSRAEPTHPAPTRQADSEHRRHRSAGWG